ncbi:DUF1589 domain-containing protein [Burkholderia sp. 4701]|nr:DUF1589 domain-containing protein [Burkholderia sp. 4701]MXN81817.1 DUF1589 domain-containing protein [Burkholderia sp. 4812]
MRPGCAALRWKDAYFSVFWRQTGRSTRGGAIIARYRFQPRRAAPAGDASAPTHRPPRRIPPCLHDCPPPTASRCSRARATIRPR